MIGTPVSSNWNVNLFPVRGSSYQICTPSDFVWIFDLCFFLRGNIKSKMFLNIYVKWKLVWNIFYVIPEHASQLQGKPWRAILLQQLKYMCIGVSILHIHRRTQRKYLKRDLNRLLSNMNVKRSVKEQIKYFSKSLLRKS